MAIENKNDKQILDLLENSYELKAIEIDFRDLNNKCFIIKSSFKDAYDQLDKLKSKWYYIGYVSITGINLIGIVNMEVSENGWLNLYWLETNKVFKKKGFSKEIMIYLKRYAKYYHMKGIIAHLQNQEQMTYFKSNLFENIGNGTLDMKWENN